MGPNENLAPNGERAGAPDGADPLKVSAAVAKQALEMVEHTNDRFATMLKRGYGVPFLALGFVTVVAAVTLRVLRDGEITSTVFVALIVLALACIAMSFTFLYLDTRIAQENVRLATDHQQQTLSALFDYQRSLDERQRQVAEQIAETTRNNETTLQRPSRAGLQREEREPGSDRQRRD